MIITRQGILKAPVNYWSLSESQKKEICNGAGPKNYGFLVPDTMYGLNCSPCFDIHDYCYYKFTSEEDKIISDNLMYENCCFWIEEYSSKKWYAKPLIWLRKRRALKYYIAVSLAGRWFYNKGENNEKTNISNDDYAELVRLHNE